MSRGVNKVILVGNLGSEPEVRSSASGVMVSKLSIATNEQWKGRDGQMQEHTEWHRVVLFNRLAEIARDYLHKGSMVYIEGKIQSSKYTDKNGVERYMTEIMAKQLQMLGGRKGIESKATVSGEDGAGDIPWDVPGDEPPEWLVSDDLDDLPF